MLVQFALVWWLTQTTGSATVLAMATLVAVRPAVIIGPVSGELVDRWNRRLVMIVSYSLILSAWGGFRRRVVTSLTGVVGIGVGMLIVGMSPAGALAVAVAGMFLAGFMNPITNGPFFALLQSNVEADMQGRVLGLVQSAAAAMMPLSLLIAGPVADVLGVRVWYLIGGAATVLAGLISFCVPVIMHVEHNGHAKAMGAGDTLGRKLESDPSGPIVA